jgi:arylsulfatase A-like enzyme
LITVCSLRADRLSSYGYRHGTTPAIDRLAADGVLFEQAVSPASWSRPSIMSVMTGLTPLRHEVRDRGPESVLPDRHPTLAELLRARGYRTAAAVTSPDLPPSAGFHRGFDTVDWNLPAWRGVESTSTVVLALDGDTRVAQIEGYYDRALQWLRRDRGTPAFLWLSDFGQHSVADRGFVAKRGCRSVARRRWEGRPPPPVREPPEGAAPSVPWAERLTDTPWTREEVDVLYDTALVCTDERVGAFLEALRREGLYDPTLVILLADHGEGLLERGEVGHVGAPYDELVRVPLIVKRPGGAPTGRRVSAQVGAVDVMPTVLQETGAPLPEGLDGRPLQGFWEGGLDGRDVCVQVDSPVRSYRALRTRDGWKIIVNRDLGTLAVYRVAEDPGERTDLAEADPVRTDALYGRLIPCMED